MLPIMKIQTGLLPHNQVSSEVENEIEPDYDDIDENDDVNSANDLKRLKDLSEKLNLATRRPSVLLWNQVIDNRRSMGFYSNDSDEIVKLDEAVERNKSNIKNNKSKKHSRSRVSSESKSRDLSTPSSPPLSSHSFSENDVTIDNNKLSQQLRKDINNNSCNISLKATTKNNVTSSISSTDKIITSQSKIEKYDIKKPRGSLSQCACIPEEKEDLSEESKIISNQKSIENFCNNGQASLNNAGKNVNVKTRCNNITMALDKIRKDLITMRSEDHDLARMLLEARSQLTVLRAQHSCEEHADMLDDVTYELEEEEDMPGLVKACDLPSRFPGSLLSAFSPLRQIGLSRMNLNRRRFSIR